MKLIYTILLPLLLLAQSFLAPAVHAPLALSPASTEEAIQQATMPWRDLGDLAIRFKGVPRASAEPTPPSSAIQRQVGDRASFWIADQTNDSYYSIDATLRVVTPHAYFYVADGANVDDGKLQEAANGFEDKVYAADRRYFGSEPPTGLDGDAHVSVVNASIPGLGGYFTSVDEYPRSVHRFSNERKAIYINVASIDPASSNYYAVLAHEFEHMIQSNTSKVEQTWVKEGSAEVATEAANLGISGSMRAFEDKPDTQLDAWAGSHGDVLPHYGAAYLFISYFLEHYGGYPAAADLLTGTTRGPDSFDRFLSGHGYGKSFEDVFDDWVVANYLDERGAQDPRYRYGKLRVVVPATDRVAGTGGWQDRTVHQFAADYIDLRGQGRETIHFQADQTNRVIAAQAHSGRFFWWSNRDDLVDTRLTHSFDLTGLSSATLKFWTWYDLEEGYDYGYVAVSTDGGATWKTIPATDTQTDDPNGNNLGAGFTGKSPGADGGQWAEETADLTPYAGQSILVRFEAVTDDAYNAPGLAVDDVSIPELGYSTDLETDDGGWTPEGFVRTDGELAQPFSLQLIHLGNDISVDPVPLASDESADVEVDLGDGSQRATLVVAALGRYTTEPAHYRYSVETGP